jgi:hypothetical protein
MFSMDTIFPRKYFFLCLCPYFSPSFFFFLYGGWNAGHHACCTTWAMPLAPWFVFHFWDSVSLTLPKLASNSKSCCFCLLRSWDYRRVSPYLTFLPEYFSLAVGWNCQLLSADLLSELPCAQPPRLLIGSCASTSSLARSPAWPQPEIPMLTVHLGVSFHPFRPWSLHLYSGWVRHGTLEICCEMMGEKLLLQHASSLGQLRNCRSVISVSSMDPCHNWLVGSCCSMERKQLRGWGWGLVHRRTGAGCGRGQTRHFFPYK